MSTRADFDEEQERLRQRRRLGTRGATGLGGWWVPMWPGYGFTQQPQVEQEEAPLNEEQFSEGDSAESDGGGGGEQGV